MAAGTTERSAGNTGTTPPAPTKSGLFGGRLRGPAAGYAVWYLRIVAWLNLFGAVFVSLGNTVHRHNSGDFFTPYLLTAGFPSAAFAAFLAVTMGRRKRAAWIFNLVLATPTAALYVYAMFFAEFRDHFFNWLSTAATVLLVLGLLLGRQEFYAKGDRKNPRLAALVLLGGGAVAVAVGTLLASVFGTVAQSTIVDRILYTLLRIGSLAGEDEAPDGLVVPHWVGIIINLMSLALFLLTLYALFRSPRGRWLHSPEDELRLRALLDKHGERDSLGYFALRRDKAAVWSATGKSAITYRVVSGVVLASGDPIGDYEAWPGAIDAFLELARRHAWVPAVMGCSELGATIWRREAGLDALELGDEAIVEVADFTLEGRSMRGVRQAVARVERAGYTVRVQRAREMEPEEFAQVPRVAAAWRGAAVERGFSMALSRLGDPADGDCVLVTAYQDGVLRGVLNFVPWGRDGLSLDLMRRDRSSDNGLNEFMIAKLIQAAPDLGVKRLSLNFAVFRSALERGERIGAGYLLRMWRGVLVFVSRWFQIESLYRFNVKFRPEWEPRFISFPTSRDLPRIAVAALEAEAFLVRPKPLQRLLRRP